MFEWLADPNAWVALLTLTVLEIVLGIDNIIFISILSGKLPQSQQARARSLGLLLAMGMRVLLLLSITWVMGLTEPLFELSFLEPLFGHGEVAAAGEAGEHSPTLISGRDLILIIGGLFLIGKSTHEIHERLEGEEHGHGEVRKIPSFASVLIQIALLDIVFSLDSVITAVGMAEDVGVMIAAVVIAVGVMMISAGPIARFVDKHPTVKMLALAFLLLIGVTLIAEGFAQHIPKGYIYSAMAFSVFVELLNLRSKKSKRVEPEPVHLRPGPYVKNVAEDVA